MTGDLLMTAEVPSECEHKPGRLAAGQLPLQDPRKGGVQIGTLPQDDSDSEPELAIALGDFTGDGVDDGVLAIICSAGGVAWSQTLNFYSDAKHIGRVDLGTISKGGREYVTDLSIDDGDVDARWITTTPGEAMCCGMLPVTASFTVSGGEVDTGDVAEHYDEWVFNHAIDQIVSGPPTGVLEDVEDALPPPLPSDVADAVQRFVFDHPSWTAGRCLDRRALDDRLTLPKETTAEPAGGRRYCRINGGPDSDAEALFLVLDSTGYDDWAVKRAVDPGSSES